MCINENSTWIWPMDGANNDLFLCALPGAMPLEFTQLLVRHITGNFAAHKPVPWLQTDLKKNGVNPDTLRCRPKRNVIRLLLRSDPLERLLSDYLSAMHNPTLRLSQSPLLRYKNWSSIPSDFEEYVRLLSKMKPPYYFQNKRLNEKLLPVGESFCQSDALRKRCWCSNQSYTQMLDVTEIRSWYPAFVREFALEATVSDPRWGPQYGTPKGCWWAPPNTTCANAVLGNYDSTAAAFGCRPRRGERSQKSTDMCSDFYSSKEIRHLARSLMEDRASRLIKLNSKV